METTLFDPKTRNRRIKFEKFFKDYCHRKHIESTEQETEYVCLDIESITGYVESQNFEEERYDTKHRTFLKAVASKNFIEASRLAAGNETKFFHFYVYLMDSLHMIPKTGVSGDCPKCGVTDVREVPDYDYEKVINECTDCGYYAGSTEYENDLLKMKN